MNPSQIGDISHVDYGLLVHSGERDSGRIEVASSNLAQSTTMRGSSESTPACTGNVGSSPIRITEN
jgi:hypothetical protein